MRNYYQSDYMFGELEDCMLGLQKKINTQKMEIEMLRIKTAKYKALFFHRTELGEKMQN